MQKDLDADHPELDIHILGINEKGLEYGNTGITSGRDLPWLQDYDHNDDGGSDTWQDWEVTFRDVVVLNTQNVPVAIYNLTSHNLAQAENYQELRDLLVQAASAEDATELSWQNPTQSLDVNNDTFISPIDALLILNKINADGAQELAAPSGDAVPPPYYDTSGDGFLSPLDALLVLNELNRPQQNSTSAVAAAEYDAAGPPASATGLAGTTNAHLAAALEEAPSNSAAQSARPAAATSVPPADRQALAQDTQALRADLAVAQWAQDDQVFPLPDYLRDEHDPQYESFWRSDSDQPPPPLEDLTS